MIFPGAGDFGRGLVGEAAVGAVVVAVDVSGDHLLRLVEVWNSFSQMQRSLSFENQDSMKARLSALTAVAATAMRDPEPGASQFERSGGERGSVVGCPASACPGVIARRAAAASTRAIASFAGALSSSCQPTISRVQQSIAAIR